jgi:hypothetical protein
MFLDGWVGGWVEVKAVLRIAYSNQQIYTPIQKNSSGLAKFKL